MSIFLSHKFIAPRSFPYSKVWSCTQQGTRIVAVPQYLHPKAKPQSFLRTFSRGRGRYWSSCYYLTAHSRSSEYRSQASRDSRYGSLCGEALPPRGRSIHLHPTHAWRSTRSWEWLNRLDARIDAWSEKEKARSLIRDSNQADLDKWKAHWKEWKSQGLHKLSKWENNLYEWERQGKTKLSIWQDCCYEDGEYAQMQAQLAKKDFEEFMRLVEADPYGILFGWKRAGRGNNDDENRNQDSSWMGSDCPTRDFDIWDSGPAPMAGSKCVQKPESKPPSHANTRSAIEEETQVDGFEFDPISMRNVPKNLNSESSILVGKTEYAKKEFNVANAQFETTAPVKAETLSPTQPSLDETNKEHLSTDSITTSQIPIGAKQHAQDWLVQEGFGIKKAGLEPFKNDSNTIQHARDDYVKPSEIETVLNRHLKAKGLIATASAKQPVLKHEAKERPGREVDPLRANGARSYVGRSDIAAVSEQHGAETKTKDISTTTAKIYVGEDTDHRHDPSIHPHELRKSCPPTQDLQAGSSSKEQPAHAADGVQAENSPLGEMIGKCEAQLPQQTTRVEPEEKTSSTQCHDVFGATSAKIGDTGLKSANSKFDSPPTIKSPTSKYRPGSTVKELVEPEEESHPEPSSYKILAFDPTTTKVYSTQIIASVMPLNDGKKLSLLEAISIVTAPAKFLPHLTALGKSGYELVLASDTVMIFKKAKQTKRSLVEKISVEDGKYPRHINPIDGTMTQTGNFASPTGFVNYNAPVLPQVEDGRPVPLYDYDWSSGKANDTIHWQDKGSSGSRPRWEEHHNAKNDSRRTKSSEGGPSLTSRFARIIGRCTRNVLRIMGKTFIVVVWSLAFIGLCNAAQAAKSA